jgi:predicted DsbA family dithiol-disulfide isomerase
MQPDRVKLDVLGVEDSTTASRPSQATTDEGRGGRPISIELDVVSDVICPWCYVGKRRLERALPLLGPGARVNVTWRPFQLNPSMPPGGMGRVSYRRAKFGSLERSAALDARLVAVGGAEGIAFRFDRIARTPNTLDAHRLIRFAGQVGVQDAVVERLFRAYFEEGVDVGDPASLAAVAAAGGMDRWATAALLAGDEGVQDVVREEGEFKALGIDGVPSFVAGGIVLVAGAAEPHVIADALRQASSR